MELMINGAKRSSGYPANGMAIFALRNELNLKGVRMGCGEGHCGSCTVLIDGVPTTSCNLPLEALAGKHVTTPEGVGTLEHLIRFKPLCLKSSRANAVFASVAF